MDYKYDNRTYRTKINRERFRYFTVKHYETDLLIGISGVENIQTVEEALYTHLSSVRSKIESFIWSYPEFLSTYKPLDNSIINDQTPYEVKMLFESSAIAGTGPMAGIAGLFSESAGEFILEKFSPDELIIENGGDVFANVHDPVTVSIFAGESPLSEKIGIALPAGRWGVCTSSGKVGPSTNFGHADALTTVCKSPIIADQLATGLSNLVQSRDDINPVLEKASSYEELLFTVIIVDDQVGMKGSFEIVPL